MLKSVRMPYGRSTLDVRVPTSAEVILPREIPGLQSPADALRSALRDPRGSRPLRELVSSGAEVGISVCDVTRAFPARLVLPVVLDEMEGAHVTVFVATGTHRACTSNELRGMLGDDVLRRVEVVQHDAFDLERHLSLGRIPGTETEALVERAYLEQDVRVTLGFIEPHFFAGFSGGPKMVAPGLGALPTVLELHSASRIGHPSATWGVTDGNPVHTPVRWIAEQARVDFALDVALNNEGEVSGVFAGDLAESHPAGCDFVRSVAMVGVEAPFDVVVTSNGGYPLDQNLYQSVKGMSAAAQIVDEGGAIVIAAECSDGLPAHGRYGDLLASAESPEAFLESLATLPSTHDQWQVQVQAMVQSRSRVFVKTDGLSSEELRRAWLQPASDVNGSLADLVSEGTRVAVLPQGPQTIPYVRGGSPAVS